MFNPALVLSSLWLPVPHIGSEGGGICRSQEGSGGEEDGETKDNGGGVPEMLV